MHFVMKDYIHAAYFTRIVMDLDALITFHKKGFYDIEMLNSVQSRHSVDGLGSALEENPS